MRLQVLPVCTEEQYVGEGALRRCLLMLEEAWHIAEVHAQDVAIVETSAGIRRALEDGKIALLLAIEGAEPVGSQLQSTRCAVARRRPDVLADLEPAHHDGRRHRRT